jgi:DNA-directed RNA polymerase subunit RPC12/RpoP
VGSSRDDLLGMDAAVYLMMGGFVLFFGLMTLAMSGFIPVLVWICTIGGIAPGLLAVLYGLYRWRVERHLRAIAMMARTWRRIHLDEFARRAGRTRLDLEERLAEAVDRGYVAGFVDRTTQEFVVQEAVAQQVYVEKCPTCGARVDRWAFPEERFPCPYCSAGIFIPTVRPR